MQTTTTPTRTTTIKLRLISPNTKKIVGYERLRLIPGEGAVWEYSVDGKSWDKGIFEGDDYLRDMWSGRRDPNGNEIYENDWVAYAGHVNLVVFRRGIFGYINKSSPFNSSSTLFQLYDKQKVVGDIHSQPTAPEAA